jgi:phosphoribosylaminoimidazolecarboxamide formyltransferase/IMP cyclohydrolase
MHSKLYAGMLAHPHTASDAKFVKDMGARWIDMVLVNFYPLEKTIAENPVKGNMRAIEIIRQNIDVGGPTAVHTSRKGFLATAVATRPADYAMFAEDLRRLNGRIGLESRLKAVQHASADLSEYYKAADMFMQQLTLKNIGDCYEIIGGDG